ncbi:hypothetical protein V6N11_060989 [Hibiscus sabdariffa]|uniref:BED-type domain-containing protein n=1 Tax=Hibiscus sabdariffa TaxID=183260 RepID=A0ABR2QSA7_9ROSI
MPRSRRKEGATPSDDYGWRWGEAVEGSRNNVKCKFCERIITGGITRLKEHLAGKTGNVKACESVSAEVRKNIAEQLKEFQKEKAVRQRRKEELEERIRIEDHGDYGDSDEEEDELTIARRESIRSRHEWEERQRQRARTGQDSVYEPGGGSNSASQLFRSFSVRKPGRSEREHQWTNFDSPGARLANMDPVLERSKSSKQPKLTTSFLKNAKAKLGRAISKLILHEALPARIAESPFLPPVLQVAAEIGKSVKGPSAYEVTGVYLDEEYTEIQEWVNGFKPIWKERGVTLMSTYARRPAGQDMMKVIDSNQFWKKAADVLKIQELLVKVLRMCDGDEKPTMGFIYEAMDRAKLAIQRDCHYYQKYWDIIDRRWSRQLHNDLHSAGYYLNPQFLYGANSSNEVLSETMAGVRNVIQRIEPSMNDQILAMNQLLLYRDKVDSFGTPLAQAAILKTNPGKSRISS